MLILTRKPGQRIRIGTDVKIIVLDTHPGQCRLGIEAPRRVDVVRTELEETPKKEKKAA